jgi:WhiB family transcriptional regulator, redox-sensing transcriptional regulator
MHAQARLRPEVVMAAFEAARPRLAVAPGSPASFDDPNGWRKDALCRGVDTNLFFPAGELGEEPVLHAETAKAVCFTCPVREECLEYALATDQPFGVWGGTTEAERRSIRRRRRRRVAS